MTWHPSGRLTAQRIDPTPDDHGLLRWAPPDTTGFTALTVPSAGGVVTLDDSTDYVLSQVSALTKCVTIKGGRNIVWIGGESKIDTQWSLNESDIASVRFYQSDSATARTANAGRIIHLEGFWAHGYYASADIQANCPEAILQVQNSRVEGGAWGRQTSQGDPTDTPHPDSIQLWGGVQELRVDKFTGAATYQGLTIDADQGPVGPVYLHRTNMTGRAGSCEAVDSAPRPWPNYVMWTGQKAPSANVFVDSGSVWINHPIRSMAGGNVMWPAYSTGVDAIGTFGYWPLTRPDCLVLDATDNTVPGRIYEGLPPAGDWVPESVVGLGYVSPGYLP